jgi:hypothetical protein
LEADKIAKSYGDETTRLPPGIPTPADPKRWLLDGAGEVERKEHDERWQTSVKESRDLEFSTALGPNAA